jgi:hypothetical protein
MDGAQPRRIRFIEKSKLPKKEWVAADERKPPWKTHETEVLAIQETHPA